MTSCHCNGVIFAILVLIFSCKLSVKLCISQRPDYMAPPVLFLPVFPQSEVTGPSQTSVHWLETLVSTIWKQQPTSFAQIKKTLWPPLTFKKIQNYVCRKDLLETNNRMALCTCTYTDIE